ncbi:MAG: YeiH family protein [Pseudoclavibacter sp.]
MSLRTGTRDASFGAPSGPGTEPERSASVAARAGRRLRAIAPGLLACLAAAAISLGVSRLVPNLSPLLVAIVLGVVWRNVAPVPAALAAGVEVSAKKLLRTGIVLLGIQVSLDAVLGLGPWTILLVGAAVAVTFVATMLIGRALGIPLSQRILIAAGFSICGAAAVAAAEGVTEAKREQVALAVALVVVFGTLMIAALPLASALVGLDEFAAGIWIGASTHEVAQVVAAGGLVGGTALATAVTVKLARVVLLAPVMAVLAIARRRAIAAEARAEAARAQDAPAVCAVGAGGAGEADSLGPAAAPKLPPIVPLFIVGFIAAMLVRTTGMVPDAVLSFASIVQQVVLSAAMFALGLGVHVRGLLRVGGRSLVLAALATLLIAGIGLAGALLIAG